MALSPCESLSQGHNPFRPCLIWKNGTLTQFIIDGKPFIILGGQVNNDSAYSDRMVQAWTGPPDLLYQFVC